MVGLAEVGVKRPRHEAREDQQERRPELEEGAEDRAQAPLVEALRRERALHEDLVHRPVEAAQDEDADEHAGPGHVGVGGRADHREHVGRQLRLQPRPATDGLEAQDREHGGGDEQHRGLKRVGVDDRPQAALHRVEARHQAHAPDHPEARPAEDVGEDDRRGPQRDRDLGQHGQHDHEPGEQQPHAGREAALQELGHGVDAVADVEGQEEDDERHDAVDGHPLEAADRHADREAAAGEADEVLGRDVRREHRGADEGPAQLPARQEVALGPGLPPHDHEADEEHGREVGGDDEPVERLQGQGAPPLPPSPRPPPPPPPMTLPPELRLPPDRGQGREHLLRAAASPASPPPRPGSAGATSRTSRLRSRLRAFCDASSVCGWGGAFDHTCFSRATNRASHGSRIAAVEIGTAHHRQQGRRQPLVLGVGEDRRASGRHLRPDGLQQSHLIRRP